MSPSDDMGEPKQCTPDELMRFSLLTSPSMIFPTIMLMEALRTIPGELRMIIRIVQRRRPNIAELLFFHLKYLAILAVVGHLLIQYTKGWLDARGCWVWHWLSALCIFFCSSLVSLTLAFRCYIIFESNKRIGAALLVFVAMQLAASMALAVAMDKYDALNEPEGYCVWRDTTVTAPPSFQFNFYYIASCVCDLVMITLSGWKLMRVGTTSLWPLRMFKTSRLLFQNNIRYVATVCLVNITQLILSWTANIPDTLLIAISIQVCVGLQQLQAEQDAVHGHQGFRPTAAESSVRGPGAGAGGGSGGRADASKKYDRNTNMTDAAMKRCSQVDQGNGGRKEHYDEVYRVRPLTSPRYTHWSSVSAMKHQQQQQQNNGSSIAGSTASANSTGPPYAAAHHTGRSPHSASTLRSAFCRSHTHTHAHDHEAANLPSDTPQAPHRLATTVVRQTAELLAPVSSPLPCPEAYSGRIELAVTAAVQSANRPTTGAVIRMVHPSTKAGSEPQNMDHYAPLEERSQSVQGDEITSAYSLAKQRKTTRSTADATETARQGHISSGPIHVDTRMPNCWSPETSKNEARGVEHDLRRDP